MIQITKKLLQMIMVMMALTLSLPMNSFAQEETLFVKGTKVNGVGIGDLTVEGATEKITAYYAGEYKLKVTRKGGTSESINGADIGYRAAVPEGLQAILDQQNASGRITGPAAGNSHTMAVVGTFDQAAVDARVQSLSVISGSGITMTTDARISEYQEGKAFAILPEVRGNSVDVQKASAAIKAALTAGQEELNLYESGCYHEVNVTSEDENLKKLCQKMNQYLDMVITYTFGEEQTVPLGGGMIASWLSVTADGQVGVNRESAAAFVRMLAETYDTVGKARVFHTAAGTDVELTGPYGWRLDQAAEIDALIGMILTGQSQSREPQYAVKAAGRNGTDWGTTYVEIDLTGQHVYLYQDGIQIWDAPCVTGNLSKGYTTPPGIYSLAYKQRDKVLRGAKQKDGTYEYESPVKYWMPFNGGIGLHDADWRSKFGGTIYQYSGSHGCINLPPKTVPVIYDFVYAGIPVICYN